MKIDFSGKVAVITGGARGIGKAIALTFAESGAVVAVCDLESEELYSTEKEVRALSKESAAFVMNVVDGENVVQAVNKIIDKYGRIDILINNAGITRDNLLMRMKDDEWDAVLAVNLKGVFNCTKAVIKHMTKQRYGRIVNIASVVGVMGNAGQANYAASKGGVIAFTKSVAKEVATRNINVNAVAPGFIKTKMTEVLPENVKENLMRLIPQGRLGEPQDIANVCVFLASGLADYITGQTIVVDGGMVM